VISKSCLFAKVKTWPYLRIFPFLLLSRFAVSNPSKLRHQAAMGNCQSLLTVAKTRTGDKGPTAEIGRWSFGEFGASMNMKWTQRPRQRDSLWGLWMSAAWEGHKQQFISFNENWLRTRGRRKEVCRLTAAFLERLANKLTANPANAN